MEAVTELRRDKLTGIIGHAHRKLQAILVGAGIDPAIARMIAATRVYQLLPVAIRQQLATAELEITGRMAILFRDVMQGDVNTIKELPTE